MSDLISTGKFKNYLQKWEFKAPIFNSYKVYYVNFRENLKIVLMSMELKNLKDYIIPFDKFPLHWRFDDEFYSKLNQIHLDQIQPIAPNAAKFLWEYSSDIAKKLINRQSFECFTEINVEDETIKKGLFHRGLAFQKDIYMVWQPDTAVITQWKIFVKFFHDFHYFPDDILIFDNSLNWGILIHNGKVIFGSNAYD